MLRIVWWIFSPTFRKWHSAKASNKTIAQIMEENGVNRNQAIAIGASEVYPMMRQIVLQWKEEYTEYNGGI